MIEINKVVKLISHVKGWPAQEARSIDEAAHMILGSPYCDIPEDIYKVMDKNETYSLLAVYRDGKTSITNRYMAVNMKLIEKIKAV